MGRRNKAAQRLREFERHWDRIWEESLGAGRLARILVEGGTRIFKMRSKSENVLRCNYHLSRQDQRLLLEQLGKRGYPQEQTCLTNDDHAQHGLAALLNAIYATTPDEYQLHADVAREKGTFLQSTLPENSHSVRPLREVRRQQKEEADRDLAIAALNALYNSHDVSPDRFPRAAYEALFIAPHASNYAEAFGAKPSVPLLISQNELTPAAAKALRKVAAEVRRQRILEEAREGRSAAELSHSSDVPAFLGISTKEFIKWRDDGRIPVSDWHTFKKWGKTLQTSMHHPSDLVALDSNVIAKWRRDDYAGSQRRKTNAEPAGYLADFASSAKLLYGCSLLDAKQNPVTSTFETATALRAPRLRWGKMMKLSAEVETPNAVIREFSLSVFVRTVQPKPAGPAECEDQLSALDLCFSEAAQLSLNETFQARISDILVAYRARCPNDESEIVYSELQKQLDRTVSIERLKDSRLFLREMRPAISFARVMYTNATNRSAKSANGAAALADSATPNFEAASVH